VIHVARGGAVSPEEAHHALLVLVRPPPPLTSWPERTPSRRAREVIAYYAKESATIDPELSTLCLNWLTGKSVWQPLARRLGLSTRQGASVRVYIRNQ